jgi:thiol-disulfide isomerase/thioredoxin
MRLKWIVAAVAALALAWTVLNLGEPPWAHDTTLEACGPDAKPASLDFTLKNAEDVAVNLAQYKGKVVLLDFWATWCGPCKVEIPWFVEFQERYGSQGFQVVGVSVDDTAELLQPFIAEYKMNYPVLQGLGHDDLMDAYGPMLGIPVSVLISRTGSICMSHTGLVDKDALEEQIKSLL